MSRGCQKMLNTNVTLEKITLFCQRRKLHKNCAVMDVGKKHKDKQENLTEEQIDLVEKVIMANTEISRDHLTPELKLHLLTPNCRLYNEPFTTCEEFPDSSSVKNYEKRIFHEPFWSIYWPGGQALTRFILDHGTKLMSKSNGVTNFLDIGSGCGASAIAAKMIGASRVVANDIDQVACVAAKLNASLNGVAIETTSKNLLKNRVQDYGCSFDIVLVGDLLYDDEMAETLIPWLEETARSNGSRIYLGDPGRHALTDTLKKRMEFKEKYLLPENVRRENYGHNSATVWQFKTV